jgi:hypothetical protein
MKNAFPHLNGNNFKQTSPETSDYNCIAWAAEEDDRFWWPIPAGIAYWPQGVSRSESIESFLDAFRNLGYEICQSGGLEIEYQKVAIYVNNNGNPTHMARQLPDGSWTSKLGQNIDINHSTLDALHGPAYGTVTTFMRRLK